MALNPPSEVTSVAELMDLVIADQVPVGTRVQVSESHPELSDQGRRSALTDFLRGRGIFLEIVHQTRPGPFFLKLPRP